MPRWKYRGFIFVAYNNDHSPEHIHVTRGRGKMKIILAESAETSWIYSVNKAMSDIDAARALRIAREERERMLKLWRKAHDEEPD